VRLLANKFFISWATYAAIAPNISNGRDAVTVGINATNATMKAVISVADSLN
jgi:hypothetical protein